MTIYQRTGECNKCGECCGYPLPDGRQVQPWDEHIMSGTQNWSDESIMDTPFFQVFRHPKLAKFKAGFLVVEGKKYRYAWEEKKGLCREDGNVMCPFLRDDLPGEHPCALWGTAYHWFWARHCEPTPPLRLTEQDLEIWKKQAPSCSHVYVKIEDPQAFEIP